MVAGVELLICVLDKYIKLDKGNVNAVGSTIYLALKPKADCDGVIQQNQQLVKYKRQRRTDTRDKVGLDNI